MGTHCVDLLIETVQLVSGLSEAQRVKCEAKWPVKNEFISVGGLWERQAGQQGSTTLRTVQ